MESYRLDVAEPPNTLGALELTSIALGYLAADRMVKKASIRLLDARPYSPGKFLILFTGEIAAVQEALEEGVAAAGTSLFDQVLIPQLLPALVRGINRQGTLKVGDTLGIIETFSALSAIDGTNEALKAVEVDLESLSLLQGLGGKAFAVLGGTLSAVEAALQVARDRISVDMLADCSVVSQVSADLLPFLPGRSRHVLS